MAKRTHPNPKVNPNPKLNPILNLNPNPNLDLDLNPNPQPGSLFRGFDLLGFDGTPAYRQITTGVNVACDRSYRCP